MKNIFKLIPLALITLFFSACGDVDLDPQVANGVDGPFGSFVRLDIKTGAVLDVTNIATTSFGGTLSAPSKNVASHSIKVRRVSNGAASDYLPFFSTSSFPAEFIATPATLAAVFGLTAGDLIPGDRFDFEATSVGTDGSIVTFNDFGPNLQGGPGQAQGYRFNTFLSCPFIQANAVGTYKVLNNGGFFGYIGNANVTVLAGSNANELIMVDPMGHLLPGDAPNKYNVKINVNAGSGQATVSKQVAWDSGHPVCCATPYGIGTIQGSGFVFSCAGAIVLNISSYGVAAGSFGSGPYVLQKL
jgi:hypothetical protein